MIICGLSNGDMYLLKLEINKSLEIKVEPHAELQQVHDFGVNTLDAKYDSKTGILVMVTGGDDQQISVISMHKENDSSSGSF